MTPTTNDIERGIPRRPTPAQALSARKHVILCCDCEGTPRQLELLWRAIERANAPANFFFVGDTAREMPSLVREIASRHQSETHTMRHENLRKLGKRAQRETILSGKHAVEDVIQRPTRGFRAPYHAWNQTTADILNEEGFVFDASMLYYFPDRGNLHEVKPTWFREWMPLYRALGIGPEGCYRIFKGLVRMRRVSVLPAHPHYAAMNKSMARAFSDFLRWCRDDQGAVLWSIDAWLQATEGVRPPEWTSPLGPQCQP